MASRAELLGGILQWYIVFSRATSSMSNSNSHQLSRGVIKVIPRTSQCSKLIYPWKAKDNNKPISLHPWKLITGGFGLRARWAVSESPLNDIYLFSLKPRGRSNGQAKTPVGKTCFSLLQYNISSWWKLPPPASCGFYLHSNSDSDWNSSCNIHTIPPFPMSDFRFRSLSRGSARNAE